MVKLAMSMGAVAAPNVVVILTDDQGYGDLSGHGNPDLRTPNLDRLRGESTSFARFFVSPTCAPTRAALLSGRHEFSVGVSHTIAGRSLLRPGVPTLAEVMRDAGHATAIFGKWHLGDAFPCRPEDRGFDEVFVHGGGGIGQTPDYWGNGYFDPMIRGKEGWEKTEGYCTDVFFREAEGWMGRQVAAERPFFLWLATNAPHAPYIAPKGAEKAFKERGIEDPAASFYAMIGNMDENVGSLMAAIEKLGIAEETIVIFMTDNGSAMARWNAGMRGAKGTPHEGGVRVPWFVRWPGKVAAGAVIEAPAAHVDLMPTLAGLCGAELPEGWKGDGIDLSEGLLGMAKFPSQRTFFTHVGRWPGDESPERFRTERFSVRDERWRLVGLELFDMHVDPGQSTNVFADHPAEAQDLLLSYGRWWDSIAGEVRTPVRYEIGDERGGVVRLTAHDWWPSKEEHAPSQQGVWDQQGIRGLLEKARVAKTRNSLPGTSGHWKLRAARPGNYRIRMMLVPPEASDGEKSRLARLRPGSAHVRVAREEMTLQVLENALEVTVMMDLDAGPLDLEAWFEGQLAGERKLGALFVEIERTGDRIRSAPEFKVEPAAE